MPTMLVTLDTFHLEMSPLNDDAEKYMPNMLVTLDTSHLEMSPSNKGSDQNIDSMSIRVETSHAPIGPCGPSEQSEDSCRHSATEVRSSSLELPSYFGDHTVVG